MKKLCFLFFFLSILEIPVWAQKDAEADTSSTEIELIHADRFTRDDKTPDGASKLIGNVQFKHQDAVMFCDSAYLYETNSLDAYGHVKIVEGDSLTVIGDSMFYDGNEKKARFRGNVIIDNKSSVLKTPYLDYYRETKMAHYYGGGVIDSRKEQIHLVSKIGHYFSESKLFHFKSDVIMTHPDYTIETDTMHYAPEREKTWFFGPTQIDFDQKDIYCEYGWFDQLKDQANFIDHAKISSSGQVMIGDTIEYDQKEQIGIGRCNVTIIDTSQKMEVSGDYANYFEKDSSSFITRNVLMKQDMDGDTLFLSADTLYSLIDTSDTNHSRILKTYHHTRFYKSDMQGQCDSMVYITHDSMMYLYHDPILWSNQNQMSADSIHFVMADGKIDKMYMDQNAFIISHEDSIYYNQIKGRNMIGHFKESELRKVDVFGNGETAYYPREEDESLIGVNRTQCSSMRIKIDSNQIKLITFFENPDARLIPSDDMPKNGIVLEGFSWRYAERPESRYDLFPGEVSFETEKPGAIEELKGASKEEDSSAN